MKIHSQLKEYTVQFENDFGFWNEIENQKDLFFVIDAKVYGLYKNLFAQIPTEKLYLIEAVETNKVVQTALELCEVMTALASKRNTHLVSVGGGIVQDITGFVANVLYRGIPWTFVPTTLLAGCDSCIGGKTSLNYKQYKNLLGTFYPPDSIHICCLFFATLSETDFKSGLGEVVKFNIMRGQTGLDSLAADMDQLLQRDNATLLSYVKSSLEFKKTYIEQDEFDKGVRVYLNFAHTFGHAFESVSHYEIPHGTAVAVGTLVANRISVASGILSQEKAGQIEKLMCRIISVHTSADLQDIDAMVDAIRKDKKQISTDITAILLRDDFSLEICRTITAEEIKQAVTEVLAIVR